MLFLSKKYQVICFDSVSVRAKNRIYPFLFTVSPWRNFFLLDHAVTHRGTCCFTTARVTSETRARRSKTSGWMGRARISKMRNWPVVINHSVGRVPFRSVPRPPWARSLPNQFKWFRKALPLLHLSPCNDRLRVRVPRWSTCVGGCAAPCYAHAYIRARTHVSVPFNDSSTFSVLLTNGTSVFPSPASSHYHTNCSQSTTQRFIGMSLVYCRWNLSASMHRSASTCCIAIVRLMSFRIGDEAFFYMREILWNNFYDAIFFQWCIEFSSLCIKKF